MPRPKGVTRNKNKKRKLDINHHHQVKFIMIFLILWDKETLHEIFKCKICDELRSTVKEKNKVKFKAL